MSTWTQHMTRSEWIELSKRKLDEWDETMESLEARAAHAEPSSEGVIRAKLSEAKQRLYATRDYWSKVRQDTGDVWDSVNEEVADAWEANKQGLEESMDEVRQALR
jgi:hypothetical protein